LTLKNINLPIGYGPEPVPPPNCTLMLVHRTANLHKDKHTSEKQVGAQHHGNYKLCACFATGLLLVKHVNKHDFLSN
jgi:hypothetical protein